MEATLAQPNDWLEQTEKAIKSKAQAARAAQLRAGKLHAALGCSESRSTRFELNGSYYAGVEEYSNAEFLAQAAALVAAVARRANNELQCVKESDQQAMQRQSTTHSEKSTMEAALLQKGSKDRLQQS